MTGKVFDGNPTPAAFLILILPLAAIIVLLYKAWIWILGFVALVIVWKLVDNYQWQRWSEKINPIFNQLIQENQGQVTPMDLSLKANLSAGSAKRFLARKAEEFSATSRELPEQGKVYYFITASTLGSILDDSEPVAEEPEEPETFNIDDDDDDDEDIEIPPNNQVTSQPSEVSSPPSTTSLSSPFAQLAALKEERMQQEDQPSEVASSPSPTETPQPPPEQLTPTPPPETTPSENTSPDSDKKEKFKLIQSDLAKRLDTTPSTIGRRKSDDSFAEWSQSKDPDGIAWKYLRKSRVFIPVDPDKRYV